MKYQALIDEKCNDTFILRERIVDLLDELAKAESRMARLIKEFKGDCIYCKHLGSGCSSDNEFFCANGGLLPGLTDERYVNEWELCESMFVDGGE